MSKSYLDSLPLNIPIIDISNKGLTELDDLSKFTKLKVLHMQNNNITQLPILPSSCFYINCSGNPNLDIVSLPSTIRTLYCNRRQISGNFSVNKLYLI